MHAGYKNLMTIHFHSIVVLPKAWTDELVHVVDLVGDFKFKQQTGYR
jgi:hypothetical protein